MSITTPVTVSRELLSFLHLKDGEKISRADVTKAICDYVKSRNLTSPNDKQLIIPDKALSDLLHYTDYQQKVAAGCHFWNRRNKETGVYEDVLETNDRLTFFNLQYLLKGHFDGLHEHNARRVDLGLEKVETLSDKVSVDEINIRWEYRIGGEKYTNACNTLK